MCPPAAIVDYIFLLFVIMALVVTMDNLSTATIDSSTSTPSNLKELDIRIVKKIAQ